MKLNTLNSQSIANTIWSYATVGDSNPELFDAVGEEATKKLDTLNSQEISNTVWSYAKVGYSCPKLFLTTK